MNLKQLSEIHDYKFPKINVFLQIVLTLRAYTRGRTTPLPERNIIEPTLEPFEVPSWTLLHCQQNLLKNIFRSKPHLAHSLCARATTSFETWSDFTDQLLAYLKGIFLISPVRKMLWPRNFPKFVSLTKECDS